jgi:hypothetical protein
MPVYITQFRELSVKDAEKVLKLLLEVPHFHYLPQISDIWLLYDECDNYVAWMWVTKWTETVHAIRMIDTFVRGKEYASIMIAEYEQEHHITLKPHDVIPSAQDYWIRHDFPIDTWLNGTSHV